MRAVERLLGALVALLLALGLGVGALAKEAEPASANPELEARVMRISAELRCLVCQNQTIADSNAELAVDLRRQVREMLQQGRAEREILDYMTARYGDFVLYKPPLKPSTALLWFGPALLLVGGMTVLVLILRRRSRMSAEHFDAEPGAGADEPPSDAEASPPR